MISEKTRSTLCDDALLTAREYQFSRLRALYAGERLDEPFVLSGYHAAPIGVDPYCEPEHWVYVALDDLAAHADKLQDRRVFRPLVVEFGPYGVHFVDKIFGADVFDLDGERNWQVHPLTQEVGHLAAPDLDRDPTWDLAKRTAKAFVVACVTVPLFGLPTIASALNIAVNLFGQRILMAMAIDPEAARHDLGVINDTLMVLHRWYLENLPLEQLQPVIGGHRTQPPGFGQLCGCTCQLVSARQYAEFIGPLDDQLLSVYPDGGMIHLCGAHAQHIPFWREMSSLRALQMNDRAVDDVEQYYAELRPDQILYCNPYQDMPAERILEITGGQRTVICADWAPEAH